MGAYQAGIDECILKPISSALLLAKVRTWLRRSWTVPTSFLGDVAAGGFGLVASQRHLVMPNRIAGTREFVRWVAEDLSPNTYVNIMAQYRPEHLAFDYPPIARHITAEEFLEAMQWAEEAGLTNLDERSRAQRDALLRRTG